MRHFLTISAPSPSGSPRSTTITSKAPRLNRPIASLRPLDVSTVCLGSNQTRHIPHIALATAHPAKFPDATWRATGLRPALPSRLAGIFEKPERVDVLANDLSRLKSFIRDRHSQRSAA